MARKITSIALAGAAGSAGSHILEALIQTGSFNVTVLCRKSGGTYPTGVSVKVVDFNSDISLTESMKGKDAVIDATGNPDPSFAKRLIDAAVAAGVYRFVPAEFSNDPKNQRMRSLPVFQGKTEVFKHLEKLAGEKKITFTAISNGAFLDWGLKNGFLGIDLVNKRIELMNDGSHVFSWTHLSAVGRAVANALIVPEKTVNRVCYIYSIQKSQKEVADLAKAALGADGWEVKRLDMNKVYNDAMGSIQAGDFSMKVMGDLIRYTISTPGYTGPLTTDDNDLLSIAVMDDEQVKQMIKDIAG